MDMPPKNAQTGFPMSNKQRKTGFAAIAQVEAYWEALRAGRLLPKRSDIDPRGIDQALENAFIIERIKVGVARFRVAGSHLSDLMGMEIRGMPITSLFAPNHRRPVADLLEEVFQTPASCRLSLYATGASPRQTLDAQLILLPLKSDLGDVSRALGCLVAQGDIGVAPRRFDIAEQHLNSLMPGQNATTWSNETAPAPVETMETQSDLSEPQTRYIGKTGKPIPPYLRLVKSD